ncbi:hypothetical protein KOI35_07890 [Actinoplanes bogorensis]|uniref:Uncharacterized protein n=1 Tax=Paractinoplanes bogorensis TaxID=1610840 RepID=A0ABS5YL29_9ACTN|nr:hypothetical protein [Actinoplanes bogorensis]MBU2663424.1 hypothetical protein [Actinoplanes bogorensis]
MRALTDAAAGLVVDVVSTLLVVAILLLLLRRVMPGLGNALWGYYRRLLGWLFALPVRLIRWLIREAAGRRRSR